MGPGRPRGNLSALPQPSGRSRPGEAGGNRGEEDWGWGPSGSPRGSPTSRAPPQGSAALPGEAQEHDNPRRAPKGCREPLQPGDKWAGGRPQS